MPQKAKKEKRGKKRKKRGIYKKSNCWCTFIIFGDILKLLVVDISELRSCVKVEVAVLGSLFLSLYHLCGEEEVDISNGVFEEIDNDGEDTWQTDDNSCLFSFTG